MVEPRLFRTVLRELTSRSSFDRIPEPDLVMTDDVSVTAYARAGRPEGALAASYVFHLAHICDVVRAGDTVLDVGCGPAALLAQAARLNPDVRFIGVDESPQMLAQGRQAVASMGLANVELRRDDMTRFATFADQSIDAVISTMTFHHLPDFAAFEAAFAAVARVLRPGGGVYICDFGRLRSLQSIDDLVKRIDGTVEASFAEDYRRSLRAAFAKREFLATAARHLRHAGVYSTAVSPLLVVVKSPARRNSGAFRPPIRRLVEGLSAAQRAELRQITLFLRFGGLRTANL